MRGGCVTSIALLFFQPHVSEPIINYLAQISIITINGSKTVNAFFCCAIASNERVNECKTQKTLKNAYFAFFKKNTKKMEKV